MRRDPVMTELNSDSSVDLLVKAQAGDADALNGLLTRYLPRLGCIITPYLSRLDRIRAVAIAAIGGTASSAHYGLDTPLRLPAFGRQRFGNSSHAVRDGSLD